MTAEARKKICSLMADVYESANAISKIAMVAMEDSDRIDAEMLVASYKAIAEVARIMDEEIAAIKNEMGTL